MLINTIFNTYPHCRYPAVATDRVLIALKVMVVVAALQHAVYSACPRR